MRDVLVAAATRVSSLLEALSHLDRAALEESQELRLAPLTAVLWADRVVTF